MEAREVELRGKAITKALQEKLPSNNVISILADLRKGVVASEDLLRSTKIGITVNRLKQHSDPSVQKMANELVSKWRSDVKKSGGSSTPKSANGTASPAPSATPTPSQPQPVQSTASAQPPKPKPKHTVPKDQRNTKTDKVDINITSSPTRNNCIKLMYDGLAYMSEELPDDVLQVARAVELAAFNHYQPETSEKYKAKIRSLYQNLKNKANPGLRKNVLAGQIQPDAFVTMSTDEMRSKQQRLEDEKLEKENMRVAMTAQEEKSISTDFTCGKCGQRKVSYTQAQTRSADEPMTTFCECLNCGKRWKQ